MISCRAGLVFLGVVVLWSGCLMLDVGCGGPVLVLYFSMERWLRGICSLYSERLRSGCRC